MTAVLHTESSMNLGGQELRILMEMEGLSGRGFRSVLAARPGSRILEEAASRGLKAYAVKMRGSLDPLAVLSLGRIIAGERVDIVNAHGSKDGWSAGLAARLLGKKVVRSRHVANPIRAHFFGRMVYGPLCDRVVTTSESIRRGMVERGVPGRKVVSIPTGVDVKRFHPGVEKGRFRREFNVPDGAPLVGMVSVLRGDKGPDVFIRAAEVLLGRIPEAFFALVGDGWMRARLNGMAAKTGHPERFIMPGHVRDIPHVLADLDVLALPARAPEGVPQAILQALAMKVPVAASDIGGINEVAVPGRTALGVPPGDHEALADALGRLLADRDSARTLASEGHKLVLKGYTMEIMLGRMEKLYRDMP